MADGNLLFFGTSNICIPFLEELLRTYNIPVIITQPDSLGGRNRRRIVPAVKTFASEKNIPCLQPERLRSDELLDRVRDISPEIGVVIAYGKLIPRRLFEIPRLNTVNVHFSLLPRYRGAAPVQRALQQGEERTGITIFEIAKKMDAGDIWTQQELAISPDDTCTTLTEKLCITGAPFLRDTLMKILSNQLQKRPQNHDEATLAPHVKKEEGRIDWNLDAVTLFNRFRAFTPWPGLFFFADHRMIKVKKMSVYDTPQQQQAFPLSGPTGEIVQLDHHGMVVRCGKSTFTHISHLQPECKKAMTPHCYSLGNRFPPRLS
jgi:methionyl-tRNA formyltransferase